MNFETSPVLNIKQMEACMPFSCPCDRLIVLPLKKSQEKAVIAVKIGLELINVYIIENKAFYHYNFRIIG